MPIKIGFAIRSYNEPQRLLRPCEDPPCLALPDRMPSQFQSMLPRRSTLADVCAVCSSPYCHSVGPHHRAIGCVEGIQSFENIIRSAKELNHAVLPTMPPPRFAFRSQLQLRSCELAHEQYDRRSDG
jgi:hypothetical protein